MDILERIVQAKRAQIARDKAEAPMRRVIELATTALPPRDLPHALRREGSVSIIAEIKRASPSKGDIKPGADVARVATVYEQAGAAALSVLTEAGFFLGAPEHLGQAKRAVSGQRKRSSPSCSVHSTRRCQTEWLRHTCCARSAARLGRPWRRR